MADAVAAIREELGAAGKAVDNEIIKQYVCKRLSESVGDFSDTAYRGILLDQIYRSAITHFRCSVMPNAEEDRKLFDLHGIR